MKILFIFYLIINCLTLSCLGENIFVQLSNTNETTFKDYLWGTTMNITKNFNNDRKAISETILVLSFILIILLLWRRFSICIKNICCFIIIIIILMVILIIYLIYHIFETAKSDGALQMAQSMEDISSFLNKETHN